MDVCADGWVRLQLETAEIILLLVTQYTGKILFTPEPQQRIIRQAGIVAVLYGILSREPDASFRRPGPGKEVDMRLKLGVLLDAGNKAQVP